MINWLMHTIYGENGELSVVVGLNSFVLGQSLDHCTVLSACAIVGFSATAASVVTVAVQKSLISPPLFRHGASLRSKKNATIAASSPRSDGVAAIAAGSNTSCALNC